MTPASALTAFSALLHGLRLCLFDPAVRRFAIWPWIVGAVGYPISLFGAYRAHGPLLGWLVGDPVGWWSWIVFWLTWLVAALLLLGASFILTFALVAIFAGAFQSSVAAAVLRASGVEPPADTSSLISEVGRTAAVELKKLLVLLPLMILAFIVGFVPLLAPIALAMTAWLLSYQFVDVTLDLFRLPVRRRLRFARRNTGPLLCFGFTLMVCWAVPFLGIFLAPAAAAGAAWLISREPFQSMLNEEIK